MTDAQTDLFGGRRIEAPAYAIGSTIEERFQQFHEANPHVMRAFVRLAVETKKQGHASYGAKALFEVLRWKYALETKDVDGFKLNNNYTSRYARLAMDEQPFLEDFFNTRQLRAA